MTEAPLSPQIQDKALIHGYYHTEKLTSAEWDALTIVTTRTRLIFKAYRNNMQIQSKFVKAILLTEF